jgi:putative transposase
MKAYRNLPKFNDNSYAHFITTRTYENRPYFENREISSILREEIRFYEQKYGFTLLGYVIMPGHVHLLIWWDKEEKPELNVSKIVQMIKGTTARRCIDLLRTRGLERMLQATHKKNSDSRTHRRNLIYHFWQAGFYDFNIYSEKKLLEKLEYMHNNPVKVGLVLSPSDYEWLSYKEHI